MTIIGLSKRAIDVFCMALFIILSSAYLYTANAEYTVQVVELENKRTHETTKILHIQGDFEDDLAETARKALDAHDVDRAVLFSPGGQAYEGYTLAHLFSTREVPTYVSKGTYCLSACAIAFIGGTDYKVNDGILGFHSAYIPEDVFENQQEAFKNGQQSGIYGLYYLLANGFSYEFASAISSKTDPDNFIIFTNEDDLNKHFVRTEKNNFDDYLNDTNSKFNVWNGPQMIKYLEDNPNDSSEWTVTKTLFKSTNKKDNDNE